MSRFLCGLQPVREAIRVHGERLERVIVELARDAPQLDAVARFAADHGARVERLSRGELDRMSKGARHQGVIAFAPELAITSLSELSIDAHSLLVVLDELEDPQNFGAIIRSSVALGATAIVWPEHRAAPLSAATFRASAGAIEHATLCRVSSIPNALIALKERGVACVGLDAQGDTTIGDVELTGPCALVVGAEGKGLRKTVKRACDVLARLPMSGAIASLNASVATAVGLYEAVRQRAAAQT